MTAEPEPLLPDEPKPKPKSARFAPNRIAVYLTILAGLLGAIAPVVADLDTASTASIIAGVFAIVVVAVKWLDGWQKHEARHDYDPASTPF